MTWQEVLADMYVRNVDLFKLVLSDFTDAEMLVRPTPVANHAAWQLGHLIAIEANFLRDARPDIVPTLPANFLDKSNKSASKVDDAAQFFTKAELLDLLLKVRQALAQWVLALTPEQINLPAPERIQRIAPTLGHLAILFPNHSMLHLGQFQVIRRALGKSVLF